MKKLSNFIMNHPWLTAMILCFVSAVITLALRGTSYYMNDDAGMSNIYTQGDVRTIFINVIIGYFMVFLYSFLPGINWLMIFFCFVIFASNALITGLVLKGKKPYSFIYATIYAALSCAFSYTCLTFTLASYCSAFAGSILLAHICFTKQKKSVLQILLALILIVLGFMIRTSMLYAVSICAFVLCTVYFISNPKTFVLKRALSFIALFVIAICINQLVVSIDRTHYDTDTWKKFNSYNQMRAKIQDYEVSFDGDITSVLQNAGLSQNDYEMLKHFSYYDRQFYKQDSIAHLVEAIKPAPLFETAAKALNGMIIDTLKPNSSANNYVYICTIIILTLSILLFIRRRNRYDLFGLLFLLSATIINIYIFHLMGRPAIRVIIPTYIFYVICLIFMNLNIESYANKLSKVFLIGALIISVISIIAFPLEQRVFVDSKVDISSHVKALPKNNYYIIVPKGTNSERSVWWSASPPPDNIISVGGWSTYTESCEAILRKAGIDNPFESLISKDNVFFIGNENSAKQVKTYLHEHYNIETTEIKTECLDTTTSKPIYVFRFTKL